MHIPVSGPYSLPLPLLREGLDPLTQYPSNSSWNPHTVRTEFIFFFRHLLFRVPDPITNDQKSSEIVVCSSVCLRGDCGTVKYHRIWVRCTVQ